MTLTPGTLVLATHGLGVIIRAAKSSGGAPGYLVSDRTTDPGSTWCMPVWSPDYCTRPAVIGKTVCEHTGWHRCGLHHVGRDELIALGVKPQDISAPQWPITAPHRKPIARITTTGGLL